MGRQAHALCRGIGLEIGALHQPFDLDATVLYLDREDYQALRKSYAGDVRAAHIRPPHLIAKGIPYTFIADGTLDFVISSHALEHFPNPGLAIEEWLRVVKAGGIVYAILPNHDRTFDEPRTVTSLETLMAAWRSRDNTAPLEQYRDYFLHKKLEGREQRLEDETAIERKWREQASIHVYTFTPSSVSRFLALLGAELPFDVVHENSESINIHFAIRKKGAD